MHIRIIKLIFIVFTGSLWPFTANGLPICPDSIEYRWTYDLIDGARGEVFKQHFDSIVNTMYEYSLTQNNRNRQVSDSLSADIPTTALKSLSKNEATESSYPVHEAYIARIMPVLEILYDYRYLSQSDTLTPYLTGERPGLESPKIIPLLRMYLSDAPDIDADWLYEQWRKIVKRDVMQHRKILYQKEAETLQTISNLKGYTDSNGNPLNVFDATSEEVKKHFPWSAWWECLDGINNLKPVLEIKGALRK